MEDSTLLDTYGHQEGEGFNFHYQNHGYHPLVCYDGITGDLLKIELRNGTDYSCTSVVDFLQPLLDEFLTEYPDVPLLLRGDSGFATPLLYKQCETNGRGELSDSLGVESFFINSVKQMVLPMPSA